MKRDPPDPRAFWRICVLAAPPIACAIALAGFPAAVHEPWRDVALIVLWSVAEEIVFRGALQPALAAAFARRSVTAGRQGWLTPANLVTSAAFALLHLWRHPVAVAAGVFAVSLVYGKARELSGRWWPAAALHVYFNLLLYAASWLPAAMR
jgi:membrane protease YdiL (CAAX protease family)